MSTFYNLYVYKSRLIFCEKKLNLLKTNRLINQRTTKRTNQTNQNKLKQLKKD